MKRLLALAPVLLSLAFASAGEPAKRTPAAIAEAVSRAGDETSVGSAGQGGKLAKQARGTTASQVVCPDIKTFRDRVTLFQVPLTCSAVKGLGCGGRARPFMSQLEKHADIAGAWLNHQGSVLAVVWKKPREEKQAARVIGPIFAARDIEVTPLQEPALTEAVHDLETCTGRWYRGEEVDRLSEQEARVMAERIVRRVEARVALSPEQSVSLRADVNRACAEMLLKRGPRDTSTFVEVAARYLDPRQIAALEAALGEGFGALPGELGS